MNVYLTEEEQAQQIKDWIKKYGFSIIAGILIGLAVMYGWQYWRSSQVTIREDASEAYEAVFKNLDALELSEFQAQTKQIMTEYESTPYSTMAGFLLSKKAVMAGDLETALESLQWIITNGKTDSFRQIARIRAARLMLAKDKPEDALSILNTIDDKAFSVLVNELRGDIYLAQGQSQQARNAYQAALETDPSIATLRPLLTMKLNNVQDAKTGDAA